MHAATTDASWDHETDVLVLGSGAAGLASAVVAAQEGFDCLVLEKTEYVGGTTAYSAGTCWIPDNPFQRAEGIDDDGIAAREYLDTLVGDRAPRELREAYLQHGPEMVTYMSRLGVRFWQSTTVVDYHPEIPGASSGGRALEPQPFDGRKLGKDHFRRVRPPVPEFALFGGSLMIRRAEVDQLLGVYRGSARSVALALKLGVRWALDRTRYPRGTRLTMGNALVANLYHQLTARRGAVWFNAATTELLTDRTGAVIGAVVAHQGRELRVRARRAVVLAGGGFPADPELRRRYLPHPVAQFTRAGEGSTGDTMRLAQSIGAAVGPSCDDNALWFPSSIGRRRDGTTVVFPHIWDRAKPGLVAVNSAGRRFVDESVSYHRFTRAMYDSEKSVPSIPTWLIVDSRYLAKYGLGMIYPHLPKALLTRHIKSGYLHSRNTIRELAITIGVDPGGLEQAVADNNAFSTTGVDAAFHKGESLFGKQYGDPQHSPNPNLGPIDNPPYYALAVVPTPLGTAIGLRTDTEARVVDTSGKPIVGLYACGNDATSVMGAEYPGAGCQVGAGMTFGYIATRHAAARNP
ncbi:MAG: FAD-dependent oxidoreductase [Rhodococcus sp. (in: high G+C Gram-positive bacteria)]|nr:MAG: FAD-dependent oxidoreductase [Rhodococcus sp. (in: high G+C Gram-positive bacteria)]